MSTRTITLGDGIRVPLLSYIEHWCMVRVLDPDTPVSRSLGDSFSTTAGRVLNEFRRGMHDRINQAVPYELRGAGVDSFLRRDMKPYRKLDSQWQRHTSQLARRVNTPRLIVRGSEVPAEFRERLKHRIHTEDDF